MPSFSAARLTILFVAATLVAAASPDNSEATELSASPSDVPEGNWRGKFTASDNSNCKRKAWPFKGTVRDGGVSFTFGPVGFQTVLKGEIDADGKAKISGIHALVEKEFVISGHFSGKSFRGTYSIVPEIYCYGTVAATSTEKSTTSVAALRPARKKTKAVSAAASETKFWQAIQYSTNLSDFMNYLEKYPDGIFVNLAEAQMRALVSRQGGSASEGAEDELAGIDFGRYNALVIGINNYDNLPKLRTAVNDAKAVATLLEKDYGFKVRLLVDPSRGEIIDAFDDYLSKLSKKDNLLIYYAGYGWLDEATDRGYWLPVDDQEGRRSNWLSNATITDTLKSLAAKHVMVVADSCFSGTLTRAALVGLRDKNYLRRMAGKQARVAMVSGGLEPVADDAGGGNSPFAKAFVTALQRNQSVIDGTRLFSEIRRSVILNAKQTPEYSDVRDAGHDGGDFLFVRKK